MANQGYHSAEGKCRIITMVMWMIVVVIGESDVPFAPESQQLVFSEVVQL